MAAVAAGAAASSYIWPAVISAGAGLLGGALSNKANKESAQASEALQREFAQHGVRWKVEDAKAAGLHPLYALGASTAQPSPVTISDSMGPAVAQAGQDISQAVLRSSASQREAELHEAALEAQKASTAKDYALAAAADSEAARTRQEMIHSSTGALYSPPVPGYDVQVFNRDAWAAQMRDRSSRGGGSRDVSPNKVVNDRFTSKPSEITSARSDAPYIEAGPAGPGLKEYDTPFGKWLLPAASSLGEALESMESPITAVPIVMANIEHYGGPRAMEFAKRFKEGSLRELVNVLRAVRRHPVYGAPLRRK